jgi:hypothetical protein
MVTPECHVSGEKQHANHDVASDGATWAATPVDSSHVDFRACQPDVVVQHHELQPLQEEPTMDSEFG